MKYNTIMKKVAILGLLIVVIPFLGFPNTWDKIIYTILGFIIFVQSLYFSKKINLSPTGKQQEKKLQSNIYVENGDCSSENTE